ncbi:hypothetical protein DH86_00002147 [Scytalidium sp. 3C]|nr:hypothetical protein DH86_00002147 [Scytalidium sp. 3C]
MASIDIELYIKRMADRRMDRLMLYLMTFRVQWALSRPIPTILLPLRVLYYLRLLGVAFFHLWRHELVFQVPFHLSDLLTDAFSLDSLPHPLSTYPVPHLQASFQATARDNPP